MLKNKGIFSPKKKKKGMYIGNHVQPHLTVKFFS